MLMRLLVQKTQELLQSQQFMQTGDLELAGAVRTLLLAVSLASFKPVESTLSHKST